MINLLSFALQHILMFFESTMFKKSLVYVKNKTYNRENVKFD